MNLTKLRRFLNTRLGFLCLLVTLYSLKYILVAYTDFNLGLSDPWQHIIMWTSPIGTAAFLISIGFYVPKPLISYIVMLVMDGLNSILLFANILYYRQFSDFLTVKTMLNAGKVSQGLGKSTVALLQPYDLIFLVDFVIIIALLLSRQVKIDQKSYGVIEPLGVSSFAIFLAVANLTLAETSRPRLLRNTFDRVYVVKYTGIDTFTIYDGIKSLETGSVTKNASTSDLSKIMNYLSQNYAKPNKKYYGAEKGKNVIVIHLESFQQFLLNLKINGKEVTPFLNSLYRGPHTLSFSNFYHQVGLGRTSDAENMLETSTYGISDGSLFTSLGSENTFQAAPQILKQYGYTSAVFHGNVGTFWNRNDVYKNMGYNYFFDKNYFSKESSDSIGYGIKDKLLFAESIKYLEHLQQPFYVKYLTVTNHIPFDMDEEDLDPSFKTTKTSDKTINNYFQTAHYLDQALQEFFAYLRKSGLLKDTMVVIYGDHYGLSNSEYETLAPVLGQDSDTWNNYNNVEMQRVPFMIYADNLKGKRENQVGGEIDVLPTLLHLLGVATKKYLQFGTDMLSEDRRKWIVFRNGTIVSENYVIIGGKGIKGTVYKRKDGKQIVNFTPKEKTEIAKLSKTARLSLKYSDLLNNKNLLRYYTPSGFIPVNPENFNYTTNYQQMRKVERELGKRSTSLYSENGNHTTTKLYQTDAPELAGRRSEITKIPKAVTDQELSSSSSSSEK
ncbi:LTA synthase family protein [Lactobacillus corticis]|uniref:Alkaline phosphatase n=1 Tax=Lactobacillus corticis TaxID=2201249 RepID=A0A916VHJ1_9LACO|nr:LTA synthase family protein [Lactobacillus corticis]GFZ27121.1 alkaline phosphatase [Lactobacillus corticis]